MPRRKLKEEKELGSDSIQQLPCMSTGDLRAVPGPTYANKEMRSPWMKGRPDNLDVRSCCNTQCALGRCQDSPAKEKNNLLCFWPCTIKNL